MRIRSLSLAYMVCLSRIALTGAGVVTTQKWARRLKFLIERYQAAGVNTSLVEQLDARLEAQLFELRPPVARDAIQSRRPS